MNVACPDCGAEMRLLEGKWGLFYGCSRFEDTGCRGAQKAYANGLPAGVPAKAATRAVRRRCMLLIERIKSDPSRTDLYVGLLVAFPRGVGSMDEEEALRFESALKYILNENNAWTRLLELDL